MVLRWTWMPASRAAATSFPMAYQCRPVAQYRE